MPIDKSTRETIKTWKSHNWVRYRGKLEDLPLNKYFKYVSKRDPNNIKAYGGGLHIKNIPEKKYIILKNLHTNKSFWVKYSWIKNLYYKRTEPVPKSK